MAALPLQLNSVPVVEAAFTLMLKFSILILCLQPPIHCIRISNVYRTFHSIRFNRLALLCVVIIAFIFYSLARTATLFLL